MQGEQDKRRDLEAGLRRELSLNGVQRFLLHAGARRSQNCLVSFIDPSTNIPPEVHFQGSFGVAYNSILKDEGVGTLAEMLLIPRTQRSRNGERFCRGRRDSEGVIES